MHVRVVQDVGHIYVFIKHTLLMNLFLTSFGRGFFSSRCLVLYTRNLHLSENDLKHSSKDCICFTKWLRGQNSNRLSIGLQNDECVCVCTCTHTQLCLTLWTLAH